VSSADQANHRKHSNKIAKWKAKVSSFHGDKTVFCFLNIIVLSRLGKVEFCLVRVFEYWLENRQAFLAMARDSLEKWL